MNDSSDSKFAIRSWKIVNYHLNANNDVEDEIIYNKKELKSNHCDYNDIYFLVRGNITIGGNIATRVAFKNVVPFTKYFTKTDGATIDDAEDLDMVMPMYRLSEYNSNYSVMTGNLRFFFNHEATNFNGNVVDNDNFQSFKFRTKLIGSFKWNSKICNNCCSIEGF